MIEEFQPPTDNLYKFVAIGAFLIAAIALVFALREQATIRARYNDATVELLAGGVKDEDVVPTDPNLRLAYYRREVTKGEASNLIGLVKSFLGGFFWISLGVSLGAFVAWYLKVQRYEDIILLAEARKAEKELAEMK